jgi:hypothetical protein
MSLRRLPRAWKGVSEWVARSAAACTARATAGKAPVTGVYVRRARVQFRHARPVLLAESVCVTAASAHLCVVKALHVAGLLCDLAAGTALHVLADRQPKGGIQSGGGCWRHVHDAHKDGQQHLPRIIHLACRAGGQGTGQDRRWMAWVAHQAGCHLCSARADSVVGQAGHSPTRHC